MVLNLNAVMSVIFNVPAAIASTVRITLAPFVSESRDTNVLVYPLNLDRGVSRCPPPSNMVQQYSGSFVSAFLFMLNLPIVLK